MEQRKFDKKIQHIMDQVDAIVPHATFEQAATVFRLAQQMQKTAAARTSKLFMEEGKGPKRNG